jgi:hypothetical protein
MGSGDACPIYPGKKYLDWELDDPANKPVVEVRIRDEIERRVWGATRRARRFATDDGELAMFDKSTGNWIDTHTSNAAVRSDFYTVDLINEGASDEVEKALGNTKDEFGTRFFVGCPTLLRQSLLAKIEVEGTGDPGFAWRGQTMA